MGKGLKRSLAGIAAQPQTQTVIKQRVTLRNVPVTVAGLTGVGWGTAVIGDLPEGNVLFLGAVANIVVTGPGTGHVATFNGDFAIGSAPTADATLNGAEVDIVASSPIGPAVSNVTPLARGAGATVAMLDNTDGSLELNLQLLIDDADISANGVVFSVSGELVLLYSLMLDD